MALYAGGGIPAAAQYQNVKDETRKGNRPLAEFATQQHTLFNFGWKFCLVTKENQNTDFASPALDDSSWRTLDLPHDFQFEQPWTKNGGGARGFKPMCEGWYRKTFRADSLWRGMQVSLDFGGIIYLGDVYINGHKVASTDYGYIGLEADLSRHLRYDTENVVAVYASTGPKKGSRWYTGGGLFRDVHLKVTNPTHIARHGVFITTPDVGRDRATVKVQVEVEGWQKNNVTVRTRLRDAAGKEIGSAESSMPDNTRQSITEVALPEISIVKPSLWSPDTPYLYSAEVVVYAGNTPVDSLKETFGIRKLEFSPEFGFRLNGEKLFLKGNSGHHDLGALGAAAHDRAIERMMLRLKEFGYNTIRCSHNPYSDSFARIADRVGMIIVDELIDKWSDSDYWGGRQPFTNLWYRLIPEWIKRDRNRPSVILWSLGNELQIREDWAGFAGLNDWGVTTYRIFDELVKRFDKTRPTTVAMFPARAGAITRKHSEFNSYLAPPELSCATEIASFNYQSSRYADYKEHAPHLIIFQSEAETSNMLEAYYNMDHKSCVGMAYWGAVEYWGESNSWPKKGWNYSFFSHTMRPYPQAYLIRSAFKADEPLVRIGVIDRKGGESVSWNDVIVGRPDILDHWNFAAGTTQDVVTYTNARSVELIVNGKRFGTQTNDTTVKDKSQRNTILWKNVPYASGGSIEAIARDADGRETARHRIETADRAVSLVVSPETSTWTADGMDLMYLNITAVDSRGRVVPTFDEELTVDVTGSASFVAMDNGDHYTPTLFQGVTTKPMKGGRMQVILRSKHEAGTVDVKVKAGKLAKRKTLKTK
ncbi:MAG: DUF4982 domain-containing protein [Prevotella sp.]|nr:DUF4982 domain-containing protein [Prevotella sp.]